jgi:hypothetical protein
MPPIPKGSGVCPEGRSSEPVRSLLGREVLRIGEAFEAADLLYQTSHDPADKELGEELRRRATAEFWSCGEQMADLFLTLLRYCLAHRPEALRRYLMDVLGPELTPMMKAVAEMEGKR